MMQTPNTKDQTPTEISPLAATLYDWEYKSGTSIVSAINHASGLVYQLAIKKGWFDDKSETTGGQYIARATANLHGEVSELWESYRKGALFGLCDKSVEMVANGIQPLSCAEEELADIVIRAMDCAERLGLNLGSAIARKHAFNVTREHRHGGKLA